MQERQDPTNPAPGPDTKRAQSAWTRYRERPGPTDTHSGGARRKALGPKSAGARESAAARHKALEHDSPGIPTGIMLSKLCNALVRNLYRYQPNMTKLFERNAMRWNRAIRPRAPQLRGALHETHGVSAYGSQHAVIRLRRQVTIPEPKKRARKASAKDAVPNEATKASKPKQRANIKPGPLSPKPYKRKASPKAKAKAKAASRKPAAKAEGKDKASPKASTKAKPSKAGNSKDVRGGKVVQEYTMKKGVVLGCATCRFAYKGCHMCKQTSFRGKKRN